jgi:hypothetical protein
MRQICRTYVSMLAAIALILMPLVAGRTQAQERFIPQGTRMVLTLETPLSSSTNQPGDSFTARVIDPPRYDGAIVRGHIDRIEPSGRLSGRTEMSLAFDSIELPGRYAERRDGDTDFAEGETELRDSEPVPFNAELVNVIQSDHVKMVDEEGNIISGSRGRQTIERGGIGAVAGGLIGGLIGGGKGAVIGLLAGGAAGTGSLYFDRGKELRLQPGAEMTVETIEPGY